MEELKTRLEQIRNANRIPKRKFYSFNTETREISQQNSLKKHLISWKIKSLSLSSYKFSEKDISILLAKRISNDIQFWENPENIKSSYFNRIDLSKWKDILKEFELIISDTQKRILEKIVLFSKETDKIDIASSNALTILNFSQFLFKNKNYENTRAPFADLSGSVFINTKFENSNLSYANLSQCYFYQSNFKNCDLSYIKFDQLPIFNNELEITSFIISKSGKYLACLPSAKVWEIITNKEVAEIPVWASDTASAFSPCEKFIAIASKSCEVELWEIETCKLVWKIQENNEILVISYSPCGKFLMTQAKNSTNIWGIKDRLLIKNFSDNNQMINTILFSPDGNYFTIGMWYKGLEIYKIEDLSYIKTFKIIGNYLLCFSPCGKWLFAGTVQGLIYLFKINSDENKIFGAHLTAISSIDSINFKDKCIIATSCNQEACIKLWDANSLIFLWKINCWNNDSNTISYLNLKCKFFNSLLFYNFYSNIKTFNLENIFASNDHSHSQDTVYSISITDDNKYIITFGKNPKFNIWDVQNNQKMQISEINHNNLSTATCLYNWSFRKRKLVITDLFSLKRRRSILPNPYLIGNIKISRYGKYIAFNINLSIEVWDTDLNECIQKWSCKDHISDIAISLCGKYLISMHRAICLAFLWQTEPLKKENTMSIPKNFKGIELSHSGLYCAYWNNQSIEIWDILNGEQNSFNHRGIQILTFSPHNKYLAFCDIDRKVILWEIEAKSIIFEGKNFSYRIKFLVFSHDEKHIVTYGNDGNIKLWSTSKNLRNSLEWSSKSNSICNYESDFSGSKLSTTNEKILNSGESFDTLENYYMKYRVN